ncbi:apolipoprotein N-acyltransferase [Candidatus Laterigemmans baculatus]|uniref:apolipoprotein N-acyltransferase n=1 Tax=Candidatus Laterigemmans baculatus TaxID=2770505 RepID=UPI0013DCBA88|nr:apolipoprotein N-acyltransferase [Candidatus Laterigemmans baculatus]
MLLGTAVTGTLVGLPWIYPTLFPLAWLGMALMALVATQLRPAAAFIFSYFAGAAALWIAFHWSAEAIADTVAVSWNTAAALFAGLVLWEAFQMGLFGLLVSRIVGRDLRRIWAVPLLWIVPEFWWPKIFPWSMGHLHTDHPVLLQTAEWGGVASISFLFMVAVCVLVLLMAIAGNRWGILSVAPRFGARRTLIATGVFTGIVAIGFLRQHQVQATADASEHFTVAAIQVDTRFVGWIDKLRALSHEVADEADLICWPESSTGTYDESLTHFRDRRQTRRHSLRPNPATELLPDANRYLLAGAKTYPSQDKEEGPYRNTALLVDPEQTIVGRYVKRALMPIGEYMPGEQFYPELRTMANIRKTIVPGAVATPVEAAGVATPGVLICYEDLVTWTARSTVAEGADCLIALINASAFTNTLTLEQHYRLAMLRSVENRRALVRCSATGVTGVISPTGELLASAPCQSEAAVVQAIPRMRSTTFYTRFGDVFAYLCTVIAIGLAVAVPRRRLA